MLNGYLARRLGVTSKLGQVLDSLADLIFVSIMLFVFLPRIKLSDLILVWIVGIALVRLTSIIIGYTKYHQISFLHMLSNKFTGIVLFFFPVLFTIAGKDLGVILIGLVASVSAIEELFILVLSTELQRDIQSIFHL